jgi:hypothetical protein
MTDDIVEEGGNREVLIGCVCGGIGVVLGGAVGYLVTKKKLEAKYIALAEEEIREMREHFHEAKKIAQVPKPDLEELVTDLGYKPAVIENPVTGEVMPAEKITLVPATAETIADAVREINVFEDTPTEIAWEWAEELRNRSEARPYILHEDEFLQNEREYEQTIFTYYEGDDVLCDERDTIVDDREELVSSELLEKFGHGSGDKDTLFVRNPVRELDMEITRSSGTFAQEVHGLGDDELQHSARMPRRHRGYDDDEGR